MANLKFPNVLRNNMLDEITAYVGTNAYIRIYSGSQPGGGGGVTTLLAELRGDVTAWAGAANAGVLTINGSTADSAANASGTATWFRVLQSDGSTWVIDGDVSTAATGTGDMQLNDTSIVLNGTVSLGGPNSITAPDAP